MINEILAESGLAGIPMLVSIGFGDKKLTDCVKLDEVDGLLLLDAPFHKITELIPQLIG